MVNIHERKFVSADPDKCVGCQVCEYACSFTKEKAFNPIKSRIRAVASKPSRQHGGCLQALRRTCMRSCMSTGRIDQSAETGAIIIDKDKCNGCGWCIEACDYGAMMLHPETKTVYTCDLCKDKPEGPQCVKWCPEEALTVVTSDTLAQKARIGAIRKLFQEKKQK